MRSATFATASRKALAAAGLSFAIQRAAANSSRRASGERIALAFIVYWLL